MHLDPKKSSDASLEKVVFCLSRGQFLATLPVTQKAIELLAGLGPPLGLSPLKLTVNGTTRPVKSSGELFFEDGMTFDWDSTGHHGDTSRWPQLAIWARPWQNATALSDAARLHLLAATQRETYFLAVAGWHEGQWHDGAIGHLTAAGKVASYIPAGGTAHLLMPWPSCSNEGKPIEEALAVEGYGGPRGLRCMQAALADQSTFISWSCSDFSLRAAVALVLLRKSRPFGALALSHSGKLPSTWRRLSEHLGLNLEVTREQGSRRLEGLAALIPAEAVRILAQEINAEGPVIPDSLLK